jgi:hypothetical protein
VSFAWERKLIVIDSYGTLAWIGGAIWNACLIYMGIKIEQHYLAPRRAKAEKDNKWWEPKEPT